MASYPPTDERYYDQFEPADPAEETGAAPAGGAIPPTDPRYYDQFDEGGAPPAPEPVKEPGFFKAAGDLAVGGLRRAKAGMRVTGDVATEQFDPTTAATISEELNAPQPFQPKELKETQEAVGAAAQRFDEAEGFLGTTGAVFDVAATLGGEILTNPKGVAFLSAEQLANMIPAYVGMLGGAAAGGAVAGPVGATVGALGGAFTGSAATEAGMEFIGRVAETLAAQGLPPTTENVQALLDNPVESERLLGEAQRKAVATAGVDAILTVAGGRVATSPARSAFKQAAKQLGKNAPEEAVALLARENLKNIPLPLRAGAKIAGVSTAVVGEGVSEAAGQFAATGKINTEDVLLETLAGAGMSVVEVASLASALRPGKKLGVDSEELVGRVKALVAVKAADPNFDMSTEEMMNFIRGAVTVKDEAPAVQTPGTQEAQTQEAQTQEETQVTPLAQEEAPVLPQAQEETPVLPQAPEAVSPLDGISDEELISELQLAEQEAETGAPEAVARAEELKTEVAGRLQAEAQAPTVRNQSGEQVAPIEALRQGIAADLGSEVVEGAYTDAPAPKSMENASAAYQKLTGRKIFFFSAAADAPVQARGVTGVSPDAIFINVNSDKPHLQVMGHELLHDMKQAAPELYTQALPAIRQAVGEAKVQEKLTALNAQRKAAGRRELSQAEIEEEVVADFFGEQFTTKEFWKKVERQNPSTFALIVEEFISFIQKIKSAFTGDQLLDMQKAQAAAAEALVTFREKRGESTDGIRGRARPDVQDNSGVQTARGRSPQEAEGLRADGVSRQQPVRVAEEGVPGGVQQTVTRSDEAGREAAPRPVQGPRALKEAVKLDEPAARDKKLAVASAIQNITQEVQRGQVQEQGPVEIRSNDQGAVPADVPREVAEPQYQTHRLFDNAEVGDTARLLGALASSALDSGFSIQEVKDDIAAELRFRAKQDPNLIPVVRQLMTMSRLEQIAAEYPQWVEANEGAPGGVKFDEVDGLPVRDDLFSSEWKDPGGREIPGVVGDNRNIQYAGATILMQPRQFLNLAAPTGGEYRTAEYHQKEVEAGRTLGNPILWADYNEDKKEWQVRGHEGRNRVEGVRKAFGNRLLIPVHIKFGGFLRNRHVKEDPSLLRAPFTGEGRNSYNVEAFPAARIDADSVFTKFDEVLRPEPPAFYSRLEQVVTEKMGGKMSSDQLENTLKKQGVTDDEIAVVLPGLENKKVYTKDEVLEEIKSNAVEYEDVVLGEGPKIESQWRFVYRDDGEPFGSGYASQEDAQRDLQNTFPGRTDIVVEERPTGDAGGTPQPLVNPTQFSSLQLPGAVEGSYRELFVTVPEVKQDFPPFEAWIADDSRAMTRRLDAGTQKEVYERTKAAEKRAANWQDGHSAYDQISNPVVRIRLNERQVSNPAKGDVRSNPAVVTAVRDQVARANFGAAWGKLSTTEQARIQGTVNQNLQAFTGMDKVLFIEEIQGPSEANQDKMPEYLRKRIYDTGVKRALSYALNNGFDAVSWTTGEQQAERYSLEKQVDSVGYAKRGEDSYRIAVWGKDGQEVFRNDSADAALVESYVGKEILQKMNEGVGRKEGGFTYLEGLDLKVGGEGLKRLYDKTLPAMFKKYGKGEVGTVGFDGAGSVFKDASSGRWFIEDAQGRMDTGATFATEAEAEAAANLTQPLFRLTDKTPKSFAKFDEPSEMFDRITTQNKQGLASLVKQLSAGTITSNLRPQVFKVVPLQTMVDLYNSVLPQMKRFYSLVSQRDATLNSMTNAAGVNMEAIYKEIEAKFGRRGFFSTGAGFQRGERKFGEAVILATFAQMSPDQDLMEQAWVPEGGTKEARLKGAQAAWEKAGMDEKTGKSFIEAHRAVAAAWAALETNDLRMAILNASDHMAGIRQREKDNAQKIIEQYTAPDSPTRKQLLMALDAQYDSIKGMYWPLNRDGAFTVTYTAKDGRPGFAKSASAFEQAAQVDAIKAQGATNITRGYAKDAPRSVGAAPSELFNQLQAAAVEKELSELGPDATDAERRVAETRARDIIANMTEVWLDWQPETSAMKNSMRRENVLGVSADAMRGYLKYMQSHGLRVADMEDGRKVEGELKAMEADIKERRINGEDTVLAQQVVADLRARVDADKTTKTGAVARTLGKMSTFYMMTSPSIALVQMSQLGILTYPYLAVKYGPAKAAKHLTNGIAQAFSPKFRQQNIYHDEQVKSVFEATRRTVTDADRESGETRDLGAEYHTREELQAMINGLTREQRQTLALMESMARNILDISLSHEVGEMIAGADPSKPTNRVFHHMMFFMRESETASRKATILATFEAADGHKDFFKAMDEAERAAKQTLFDYSTSAKGVALRGDTTKVLMTFQTFRISAAFRIGLMMRNALKGESPEIRREAQKEFIGIMAMSGALSGALGMPFVPILLDVLSAALGDDDEPVDAAALLQERAREMFGETAGRVVTDGPMTLLNMSVSQRIGLGDVYGSSYGPWPTVHGRSYAAFLATQALGPAYSVAEGWVKSYDYLVNKGEIQKGLEAALPKPLRDAIRAYGYAANGVKAADGRRLLSAKDVDPDDVVMMALGFQPTDVFEVQRRERQLDQMSARITERRGRLMARYARGFEDGDLSGPIEDVLAFNKKNPKFAVRGADLVGAVRKRIKADLGVMSKRDRLIRMPQ